jgi:hypothetical protein
VLISARDLYIDAGWVQNEVINNLTDNELVDIKVPKRHLAEIYRFVGGLDAAAQPEAEAEAPLEAAAVDTTPATDEQFIQRQYRESPESMKRLQKELADHPDQKFTMTQLAAALNTPRGSKSIVGMLGAYGNRFANRYRGRSWPFQASWEGPNGEAVYWMTPEVAEIIKSL